MISKKTETMIDHKRFALSMKGTVNLNVNYGNSPSKIKNKPIQ